jgi:hypothetical protein
MTVLLAGCATLGGDIRCEAVIGVTALDDVWPSEVLIAASTLSDGREVYSWESTGSSGFLAPGSVGVYGGSGMGLGISLGLPGMGGGAPRRCDRMLVFEGGRVVEQTWQGSAVFCSQFRRE